MKEKIIRLAPILLIIAIAVLSIILVVNLGRMMFGAGNESSNSNDQAAKESSIASLLTVEAGRSVKMTVRGPIVANEDARSYTVEVSPSARSLKTYKGYSENIIDEVKYDNSNIAYDEFVNALNKANMMLGAELKGEADNMRGVCATGHVYDFAILKNNEVEKHLWTSTCAGSKGSLQANTKQLQNLFISQIPDNEKIVNDLGLKNL
ncbi:MAG: hypothetical protein Q4A27_02130 [bacterium]|nr:hypothetical protein [bacterium]